MAVRVVAVRRELADDVPTISRVISAAFAPAGERGAKPVEVALVDELRAGADWLAELSLVAATSAGEVVGHVMCTRGHVGVGATPALALGPLSVRPDHQRQGVGTALMHAVLGAADALDEPLVALLGDPVYYARFGFAPAKDLGIIPPEPQWGHHFQVRTLTSYTPFLHGTFAYPEPFAGL